MFIPNIFHKLILTSIKPFPSLNLFPKPVTDHRKENFLFCPPPISWELPLLSRDCPQQRKVGCSREGKEGHSGYWDTNMAPLSALWGPRTISTFIPSAIVTPSWSEDPFGMCCFVTATILTITLDKERRPVCRTKWETR
ncbi:hypothetical protein CEXT_252541 [Caerostris extrusa]|uniref:Uncharacterized protein n=1 Tax=Caerostris extrusa TaxID=172846 RepID=A0AAV4MW72_CAEEX|nr:hypothetical protein CEXT_252541 [Caerostris extrusa]